MFPCINVGSCLTKANYPDVRQGSVEVAVFIVVWGFKRSPDILEFLTLLPFC